MRFLSVCSGIEAASTAWGPLGWEAVAFSEIEPFPCAVLKHHFPKVPNLGDMTKFKEWNIEPRTIDLLCGGTPCQSFSVAGLRKGLDDPRGNLSLVFLGVLDRFRPRWVVWENVPGVLSSGVGRDFGAFLGGLGQLGYGWAYRILDAQYFGVPQQRRRVFVVGHLGDWRRAAAVLFERQSLSGNPPPSRKAGEGPSGVVGKCLEGRSQQSGRCDPTAEDYVISHSLRAEGCVASEDGTGRGTPLIPVGIDGGDVAFSLRSNPSHASCVRRLTCEEAEALQGFPRSYTLIPYRGKPAADGPRYKALGNSWAVPVVRWIGQRIQMVEQINA